MSKDIIGNDAGNGDAVRALHADYVLCSFNSMLWNLAYDFGGAKFVTTLCYSDQYAEWTVKNFQRAAGHPQNSHVYFVGVNEADLARVTVAQHVVEIQKQMDIVLAADNQARCVIGHLSQLEPLFKVGGHLEQLWNVLKIVDPQRMYRMHIVGFSQHVYPPENLKKMLSMLSTWRDVKFPRREIWLGEIGRSETNPEAEYAPSNIARLCAKFGIEHFVWFSQIRMPTAPADVLQLADGTLTATGAEFAMS